MTGIALIAVAAVILFNPLKYPGTGPRAPGIDPRKAHPDETRSYWIAPQTQAPLQVEISPHRWQFDFAPVEQHLRGIEFDTDQGLQLTGEHLPALMDLVLALQADGSEVDQSRLGDLIRLTFPGDRGRHLEQVLLGLYRYSLAQPAGSTPLATLSDLDAQRDLQQRHLGADYAERLWGSQNRMRERLLRRREQHVGD